MILQRIIKKTFNKAPQLQDSDEGWTSEESNSSGERSSDEEVSPKRRKTSGNFSGKKP